MLEEGESPEDCVLREVMEETGLWLNSFRLRGIVRWDYVCGMTNGIDSILKRTVV